MPTSALSPEAAGGIALIVLAALAIYLREAVRVWREGGKVDVRGFDLPELLMSIVFATFFGMVVVMAIQRHKADAPINVSTVLPNSFLFILFAGGIAWFLRFRGLRLNQLFGFNRLPLLQVAVVGVGFILGALPLAGMANAATLLAAHEKLQPQPLVNLFSKMAAQHDLRAVMVIFVSAVCIQPACEEFLFRGFFYGVWKRYLQPVRAGFLSSLLFAAFHGSLGAFAGLFVLAVCLNIAYERTGCLLVPITMHGLFNLTSLAFIYWQAQQPAQP